jgi:TFIIF-interacting CTD phosphatase-like protein
LGNRELSNIIIVDNKVESYSSNLENGIPIISYYCQEGDEMLKKLAKYLIRTLKHAEDVRACISRDFYVKDLTNLQKGKRSRIFDTKEIKAIVLKARDQQTILNTLRN